MKGNSMKPTSMADKLVWIAIGSGALFWILESAVHVFVFGEGNLATQILTPGLNEIWMRLLVVSILVIFGAYAQLIINQRKRAEEALQKVHDELEQRVGERTAELARTTEQLALELTERKEAEEALGESEAQKRGILDASIDRIRHVDKDMRIVWANKTSGLEIDMSPEDLVGQVCHKVFLGRDTPCKGCPTTKARETGQIERAVMHHSKMKGIEGESYWDVYSVPLKSEAGEIISFIQIERNITDQKRAEEALRGSEARLRAIFEAAENVSLILTDLAGTEAHIVEFSPGAERMFGYDREEVIGKPVSILHLPEDVVRFPEVIKAMSRGKGGFIGESILVRKSGELFPALFTTHPIFDAEGNMTATLGVSIDITRRKQAEEALRESEAKYRQLFTTVSDAIMVFKADTKQFVDVNDAALRLYGYSKEEFLKLRHPAITEEPEKSVASVAETLAGELTTIPLRYHKKKDGTVFPVEISASTFTLGNRQVLCGVVRDITDRKRTEEHIHTLSQQLMKAQESERQRISRDLHDRVAQDLSTLKIGVDTLLDNHSETPAKTRERVSRLSEILQGTVTTVRDLAYNLRPASLDQLGLVRTVHQHCEEFSAKHGVKVDFFAAGIEDLRLDFDTKITLYRLIQEGLNNVKKHADASQVTIRLVASFPKIILRIEDNGKGFDVESRLVSAANERRMGLRTMEERVALLQGKMRIESLPMAGTKIFIEVPCERENNGE